MNISTTKLSNGLEYLNVFSDNYKSVTILVLVRVGSRYETDDERGLAHFVEHTIFKGSKNYPSSKEIGIAIERLGGDSNAFTSLEYTGYYIKVPRENFGPAIQIMSDMMKNPLFKSDEVDRERGVVIEEIRMYEDIPMRKVSQEFMADMFGAHPLGLDIAGTVGSVSKLTSSDTARFSSKYYNSENMLLVVSGGIDYEGSRGIVESSFGNICTGEKSRYTRFVGELGESKVRLTQKKLEQTHIILGGLGVNRTSDLRYAINMGSILLSGGFGSVLFQKIREQLGLAYYINSSHTGLSDVGFWDVSMGVDNKRVEEAIAAVVDELVNFRRGMFNDTDIERARNYMLGSLITRIEGSDELGNWLGNQKLFMDDILSIEEVKSIIHKITKDDIIAAWDQVFHKGGFRLTLLSGMDDHISSSILDRIK